MKKLFTLAAASALAVASLQAQAQTITVDGVLNAAEISATNYVLVGKFTNSRGFGENQGLLSLYAASTATKVYFFVGGTVQNNTNAFQLFLDLPTAGGVPAGTALPASAAGTYNADLTAKLELATDLSLSLRSVTNETGTNVATNFRIEAAKYTNATTVVAREVTTTLAGTGAALTIANDADFPMLAGARVAYRNTSNGNLTANPGFATTTGTTTTPIATSSDAYGAAGTYGWEIELDRTAIGAATGTPRLDVFVLQNGSSSNYISSDFIPQTSAPLTTNSGNLANGTFDFATLPGRQAATLNLTATNLTVTLSNKAAVAAIGLNIFPNPATGASRVSYQVLGRSANVSIVLTDLMGRTVRVVEKGVKAAGAQSAPLNTSNLAAGTYLVRVQVGDKVATRKVVL